MDVQFSLSSLQDCVVVVVVPNTLHSLISSSFNWLVVSIPERWSVYEWYTATRSIFHCRTQSSVSVSFVARSRLTVKPRVDLFIIFTFTFNSTSRSQLIKSHVILLLCVYFFARKLVVHSCCCLRSCVGKHAVSIVDASSSERWLTARYRNWRWGEPPSHSPQAASLERLTT